MKTWLRTVFVIVLALTVAQAGFAYDWSQNDQEDQEDEDYNWKTWRTHRSHGGFNGFGGFFYNLQTFDSNDIDALATSMGLDEFNGIVHSWGGLGMGHVGKGWRIGGGGYGGMVMTDGVVTFGDEEYNRSLEMDYGAGGFMFEYSPWMVGPVNFGVGAMVGGGGLTLVMSQDEGTYTWEDLYGQYVGEPSEGKNIRTEVHQGFLLAEPYVTARVHILDWMAFQGTVGWSLNTLQDDMWQFNENELVGKGPEVDFNRPFYRVGFVFGG